MTPAPDTRPAEVARVPRVSEYFLGRLVEGRTRYVEADVKDALLDLRDERREHAAARATIATLQAERDAALARVDAARREGFEAGRDAAVEAALETYYGAEAAEAIRALTPPDAPQKGDGG